jgi:hypothetical protein
VRHNNILNKKKKNIEETYCSRSSHEFTSYHEKKNQNRERESQTSNGVDGTSVKKEAKMQQQRCRLRHRCVESLTTLASERFWSEVEVTSEGQGKGRRLGHSEVEVEMRQILAEGNWKVRQKEKKRK